MGKDLRFTIPINACFQLQNFAVDIIKSTHDYWKALVTKKIDGKGISW